MKNKYIFLCSSLIFFSSLVSCLTQRVNLFQGRTSYIILADPENPSGSQDFNSAFAATINDDELSIDCKPLGCDDVLVARIPKGPRGCICTELILMYKGMESFELKSINDNIIFALQVKRVTNGFINSINTTKGKQFILRR